MSSMAAAINSDGDLDAGEPTEATLVERAKAGDRSSFEVLYRTHASRVYALCWRLCAGDEALAADMVQESFFRAWQKLDLFRGDAAFGTWLHRLVVNFVLSEKRKAIRRRDLERPLDEVEANRQAAPSAPAGLDRDLEAAVARLPERARTVLVLHDIEGFQHNEIAVIADMAVGTSKAQLHRARKLLREWLDR